MHRLLMDVLIMIREIEYYYSRTKSMTGVNVNNMFGDANIKFQFKGQT